jgi:hypothetical protein
MTLFGNLGRVADHVLEDYWVRIKERRAYLTFTIASIALVAGGKNGWVWLSLVGYITVWFLYVIMGPHKKD